MLLGLETKQIRPLLENQIQTHSKEAVKNVLQQLDADIYAVEEVSDDALLAQTGCE
jgi:hypothetical protein